MTTTASNEGRKWINTAVVLVALFLGYIFFAILRQFGEWFELEAKIPHYFAIAQGFSAFVGLAFFVIILKNKTTSTFLQETYGELLKVVWPDKNETVKSTIVITIAVVIAGFVFGFFDLIATKLLTLLN